MSIMNNINPKTCLICFKHNTKFMSLSENMPGFSDITIADLLKNLSFLNFSGVSPPKMLCYICVGKIQYCYEFKLLCRQSENMLKTLSNNRTYSPNTNETHIPSQWIPQTNQESVTNSQCSTSSINVDKSNEYEACDSELNIDFGHNMTLKSEIEDCNRNEGFDFEEKYGIGNDLPQTSSSYNSSNIQRKSISSEYIETNPERNSYNDYRLSKVVTENQDEKLYACEICNRSFNYRTSLYIHKTLHHSNKRNFICTICQKSFKLKTYLKTHMIRHTGERPYPCDICSKRFTQSSSLKAHKVIHSGERNFSCSVCQKTFKRKNELVVHGRTHAGKLNMLL